MRTNRKKTIKLAILVLILLLGIGYAALKTTLKVDGTVNVDKTSWDVHFENVSITEGSVIANPAPTTNNIDTTEMTYTINFTKPGDFFEFTTDIVNNGTIDAMIDVLDNKTYASNGITEINLPTYLTSATTYENGVAIARNQKIESGTSEKIKVRVEFKKDITASDLPSDGTTTVVFKFSGSFKQADENAIPVPGSFEDDSWPTIAANTQTGIYKVGDTKTIKMDVNEDGEDETYIVRIANTSTPEVCNTTGYSQTACGFVVEFTQVLRLANSADGKMREEKDNEGGWYASDLVLFLNGTIYNKLPSDLKNVITPTYPIVSGSGHGKTSPDITESDTTKNKLYLLSGREVGLNINYDNKKDVTIHTRTLDYYEANNNNQSRIKKDLNGNAKNWWLRTAKSLSSYDQFYMIQSNGTAYDSGCNTSYGVSPAFRIG